MDGAWVYGIFVVAVLGVLAWEFWPEDVEGFWGGLAWVFNVALKAFFPFL